MAKSNYDTRSRSITKRSPRRKLDPPPDFEHTNGPGSDGAEKPESDLFMPSNMVETHLGGILEKVEGFQASAALAQGFNGRLIAPISSIRRGSDEVVAEKPPRMPELRPERRFNEGHRWTQIGDTTGVPWRCVCHLEISYENGRQAIGTGWFSSSNTVITAGHNLYIPEAGVSAVNIRVVPGRSGAIGPFGETYAEFIEVSDQWATNGSPEHDYGMIKIAHPDVGAATGWFGYGVFTDSDLSHSPLIQSAGYPNETKPFATQWYDAGRGQRESAAFLKYRVDTEEGQSGAPVFFSNSAGQRWVVAIHVYSASKSNLGLRINETIFSRIREWSAA